MHLSLITRRSLTPTPSWCVVADMNTLNFLETRKHVLGSSSLDVVSLHDSRTFWTADAKCLVIVSTYSYVRVLDLCVYVSLKT